MNNKNNTIDIKFIILTIGLFFLVFGLGLIFIKNINTKKTTSTSVVQTYSNTLVCAFIDNDKYILFDDNGNNYICTIKDGNSIKQGDVIKCNLEKNNDIYNISNYRLEISDENSFELLNNIDIQEFVEKETFFKVNENATIDETKWNTFIDNVNNNITSSIYILDNNSDNIIITYLYYYNNNFFVIEDDEYVWEKEESDSKYIYYNAKYLNDLTFDGAKLWFLTNDETVVQRITNDNILSEAIDGNTKLDMFWLWSIVKNDTPYTYGLWNKNFDEYFPKINVSWKEYNKDEEKLRTRNEEIEKTRGTFYKNEELGIEQNCELFGGYSLNGDLDSFFIKVDNDKNIITFTNKSTQQCTIKVWSSDNLGNSNAKPYFENNEFVESIDIEFISGISFGEIICENEYGIVTYNFAVEVEIE